MSFFHTWWFTHRVLRSHDIGWRNFFHFCVKSLLALERIVFWHWIWAVAGLFSLVKHLFVIWQMKWSVSFIIIIELTQLSYITLLLWLLFWLLIHIIVLFNDLIDLSKLWVICSSNNILPILFILKSVPFHSTSHIKSVLIYVLSWLPEELEGIIASILLPWIPYSEWKRLWLITKL